MKKTLLLLFAFMATFGVASAQTAWHICGDWNGWAPENTNISFSETSDPNVLEATVAEFKTGQWGFKIIDGTAWGCQEIGADGDAIAIANGTACAVKLGGDNIYIDEKEKRSVLTNATFTLTFSDGAPVSLKVTCDKIVEEATPYYLPGTCKGWNFNETTQFEYQGNGVYTLRYDEFNADFKVVKNGQWGADNEYAGVSNMQVGTEYTLVKGGNNASLASGVTVNNAVITLTVAEDGTHKLKIEGDAKEEHTYGLVGGFQGWNAGGAPLFEEQADGSWTIDVADFPGGEGFKVSIDKSWTCFCPGTKAEGNKTMTFGVPADCVRVDGADFNIGTSGENYNVHVVLVVAADAQTATLTVTDTATGITLLQTTAEADAIFNISGQRVAQAQKGLNIIGGKKVVIK